MNRRGKRLWRAVQGEFELDSAATEVLLQLCRTVDYCDLLAGKIAASDDLNRSLAEFRQQAASVARLAAALDLPPGTVQ